MSTDLARVESGPVTLFGTADPQAVVDKAIEVADVLARVVQDRGLARRFKNKDGKLSERAFYELQAWQVLGSQLGVTAVLEWTKPVSNGWEARSVVRTLDGREIGAGEGMCTKEESNWKYSSDHSIRAMAQTRANRRALQSVLGFIPGLVGLDLSDPDASATKEQVGVLHILARERGWDHDESHRRAGVESFKDLSREEAARLIDEWSELPAVDGGGQEAAEGRAIGSNPSAASVDDDAPPMERAQALMTKLAEERGDREMRRLVELFADEHSLKTKKHPERSTWEPVNWSDLAEHLEAILTAGQQAQLGVG